MLMDSVGQALRQGRAEMACLCSLMYGALAEELKCLGWESSEIMLSNRTLYGDTKILYLHCPTWQPLDIVVIGQLKYG